MKSEVHGMNPIILFFEESPAHLHYSIETTIHCPICTIRFVIKNILFIM